MKKTASMRSAYGEALVELGRLNPDVMVLDADLSKATKTNKFAELFPGRFFNVGIAEQNMVTVAAGLATCGKIPFATTLAVFIAMRACEQIRTSVALANLNVKLVGFYGGLCTAENGPTHQCIADINMMRGLPNLTVLAPSDALSCKRCVFWAAKHKGPVYIRGLRDNEPVIYEEDQKPEITKARILREGSDAAIIANGYMVHRAFEAADVLSKQGIKTTVLDVICVKPIDKITILETAEKVKCILTVEEHNIYGGLGSAVAEVISQKNPIPVRIMGIPDTFCKSGTHSSLLESVNLTTDSIVANLKRLLENRR
jgi:transketolase